MIHHLTQFTSCHRSLSIIQYSLGNLKHEWFDIGQSTLIFLSPSIWYSCNTLFLPLFNIPSLYSSFRDFLYHRTEVPIAIHSFSQFMASCIWPNRFTSATDVLFIVLWYFPAFFKIDPSLEKFVIFRFQFLPSILRSAYSPYVFHLSSRFKHSGTLPVPSSN